MERAPCCDKTKVKRGPWSPEEDNLLKNYLEKYGTVGNWISLPQKAGLKRCGKSCRLRWLNYLRPDIKHGGFTEEEDNIILTLYTQIGSRWSVIASNLQGRTDNDVKNYWNTKLKKKLLEAAATNTLSNSNAFTHDKTYMNTIPRTCYGTDSTNCSNMKFYTFSHAMDANLLGHSSRQLFPLLPELMEIQENGILQQAEEVKCSSLENSFASFSGNIGVVQGNEEDGSLMSLSSGISSSYYYDLLNGFNFQENVVMGVNTNFSNYSSNSNLLQLQANIPDSTDQPFKGFETY